MQYIIKTEKLTKKYKNKKVVDNLNLKIEKGEIYGLLGKNGAGKTTTLCMLTQLIQKTSGKIYLFGHEETKNSLNHMGSLIEYPGFYTNLTGYENLEYTALIHDKVSKKQINEILELVGLDKSKDKLVKEYSMGMKQRLAIASALINNPEVLILDEPINGLDPQGIIEIRRLLKKLSREYKITILISSHILSEIEQIADKIGIINDGELIEELKIQELKNKLYKHTQMIVSNPVDAVELIRSDFDINPETDDDKIFIKEEYLVSDIVRTLILNDIEVYQVTPITQTLEEYFINKVDSEELEQYYKKEECYV